MIPAIVAGTFTTTRSPSRRSRRPSATISSGSSPSVGAKNPVRPVGHGPLVQRRDVRLREPGSRQQQGVAPTLFHLQWHDEIFPREGQLTLFDLLGSEDKQLAGYTGMHAETKPAAVALWRDFMSRHLAAGS